MTVYHIVALFCDRCVLGFAADDVWKCPFCRLKHYLYIANIKQILSVINIISDIKLVSNSSTITMMHGPINIRCRSSLVDSINWYFRNITGEGEYDLRLWLAQDKNKRLCCGDSESETWSSRKLT